MAGIDVGRKLRRIVTFLSFGMVVPQIIYVSECCDISILSSPSVLMKCVNASAEQTVSDGWSDATKQKKFALTSYATSDIKNYAAYAFAVNQMYAENNNYIFKLADPTVSNYEPRDPRWNKVKILEYALETWAIDCDYIVWLDADLIVIDLKMKLDYFTQKYSKAEMIVSNQVIKETTELINSGMFILKNSEFSRNWLLPTWWNIANRRESNDQEAFSGLYEKYKDSQDLDSKIVHLGADVLNSKYPAIKTMTPKSQILHLMLNHNKYRHEVFKYSIYSICKALQKEKIDNDSELNEPVLYKLKYVKPQYGIQQDLLLAILLVVYGPLYIEQINKIRRVALNPENDLEAIKNVVADATSTMQRYAFGLDLIHDKQWPKVRLDKFRRGSLKLFDRQLAYLKQLPTNVTWSESTDNYRTISIDVTYEAESSPLITESLIGAHRYSGFTVRQYLFETFFEVIRERFGEEELGSLAVKDKLMYCYAAIDVSMTYIDYHIMRVTAINTALEKKETVDLLLFLEDDLHSDLKSSKLKLDLLKIRAVRERSKSVAEIYAKSLINDTIALIDKTISYAETLVESLLQVSSPTHSAYVYNTRIVHIYSLKSTLLSRIGDINGSVATAVTGIGEGLGFRKGDEFRAGPHHVVELCFNIVTGLCLSDRFHEASLYVDKLIYTVYRYFGNNDPRLAAYYKLSGEIRSALGENEQAIRLLRQAIKYFELHPYVVNAASEIKEVTDLIAYLSHGVAK